MGLGTGSRSYDKHLPYDSKMNECYVKQQNTQLKKLHNYVKPVANPEGGWGAVAPHPTPSGQRTTAAPFLEAIY